MMQFLDPTRDGALAADLKDAGLLNPEICGRIEAALGRPEAGALDDYLLAGAEWIPEKAWLSWLIRRHGCHRFGPAAWSEEAAAWAQRWGRPRGHFPYRRCRDGAWLTAVLRPDRMEEAAADPGEPLRRAAATLREIRALSAAWGRAAPSLE